ncbi:isochorismate synthase MenF [Streptomyces sp. NPDC052415]|uniref:isochorismate synthase MenF n=1 Tax=Streptomyces sp. NPDC052415 TaxID=3365690 RepID=UPI0037D66930
MSSSETLEAPVTESAAFTLDDTDYEILLAICRSAYDQACHNRRPVLASWAKPLNLADTNRVWSHARLLTPRSLLWHSAWDQGSVMAFGTAHELSGQGADRIASVREQWSDLARDQVSGGSPVTALPSGAGPLALGGFAFSPAHPGAQTPLPDGLMWIPAVQIRGRVPDPGGSASPALVELRLNAVLDQDSDPGQTAKELVHLADKCLTRNPSLLEQDRSISVAHTQTSVELPSAEDWKDLVRDATAQMREGVFEKVVLAREVRITASEPFDVPLVVGRLRAANPGTTVFVVDHHDHTFLGATPEYLVRVENGTAHALGLAGTTPRGITPEQDTALERELVDSSKIQHEHDVVVRMLRDALQDSCSDVTAETPPRVVKLTNVQHLSTKVRGRLAPDSPAGILDLVGRLHPTPALGGHPREEALSWLAAHEGFDRSWYAGVVGWADHTGQGQFAVAIRSALLSGTTASMYAGCGLVADSDPEMEFAETCAKLRPMMSALGIQ